LIQENYNNKKYGVTHTLLQMEKIMIKFSYSKEDMADEVQPGICSKS
jgi:hypothetical protein